MTDNSTKVTASVSSRPTSTKLQVGEKFDRAVTGRYMFTMVGSAEATPVGNSPEGARVDVLYNTTTTASTDQQAWLDDWGRTSLPGPLTGGATPISFTPKRSTPPPAPSAGKAVMDLLPNCNYDLATLRNQLGLRVAAFTDSTLKFAPDPALLQVAQAVAVARDAGSPAALWLGFDGTLASGSDWVLMRSDGVVELSGRFAFKSKDDPDEAIVTMTTSGAVDLAPYIARAPLERQLAVAAATGFPIAVAVTFEAGRTAPSWAPSRMQRQAAGFWKYEALTRGEFLAVGKVTAGPASANPYTLNVTVDIYKIVYPRP